MPIQRDLLRYHESIVMELEATKNRVRHLIGSDHWPTDGQYKEAILRKVLRGHIAETFHVGTGFVCGENETSHQIDILISSRDKPILFEDRELRIITPDMAVGIIEVKTSIQGQSKLKDALIKLADDAKMIRTSGNQQCIAGLFIYEPYNGGLEQILSIVQNVTDGDENRVINCIAAGPDIFVRYWPEGVEVNSNAQGSVWHGYYLHNLAHAYFLSNIVWDTCHRPDPNMQYAWFPIEGGKETYRKWYVGLRDPAEPTRF